MSIECEGRVGYGWELDKDEIPDYDRHRDEDWFDVFRTLDHGAVIDGIATKWAPYELVVETSAYDDDPPVFIGVPLPHEMDATGFKKAIDRATWYVPIIWHTVMGDCEMPMPKVICYERWY